MRKHLFLRVIIGLMIASLSLLMVSPSLAEVVQLPMDQTVTGELLKEENWTVIPGESALTDERVLQYGTVDTWVFQSGRSTLMVPALKAVFPEVDAEKKTILVIRDRLEEVAVRS